MHESATFFHQLDWPAPGERVTGPVIWLRGWVTGKPGFYFTDIRVVGATGIHLGVLGLPRTDLATHFKSPRSWLPAEFVIGVPLPEGPAEVALEAMDEAGNWHRLQTLGLIIAADGARSPRIEGEVNPQPGGSFTSRSPHLPCHGHLDDPTAEPPTRHGRIAVFGWLLHESLAVRAVVATVDGLVFNTLESGLADDSLATRVPHHAGARRARFRGEVDTPPTLTRPACLRVYAELADGSVQLCFARRIEPASSAFDPSEHKTPPTAQDSATPGAPVLAPLPSGRPRRLLIIVRSLQPDDATLRALDVARHLIASGRWAVRLVASEDGPLHDNFEASDCAVQLVDPRAFFAATEPAATASALQGLGRGIWWRHLDAVAQFDLASTWASQLAAQEGIPVFTDPAESLTWFAPEPIFTRDTLGMIVAPIRGTGAHGAGVLLHAADRLSRHHSTLLAAHKLIVTDARHTPEEQLFKTGLSYHHATTLSIEKTGNPAAAAIVICPAFTEHPHRALFSALAAGVPLITTPSPLLTATFGPNEINFVPSGNPLALAHAMADTLANSAASNRRAAAAARIVIVGFSPNKQLARWEKLLEVAIGI